VRKRHLVLTFAVLALLSLAVAGVVAGDDKSHVKAGLVGYQETPAISTTGSATFVAAIDDQAQEIHYTLVISDLEGGNTLFAHIHFGQRDVAGGVAAFLCGGGSKPACPNGSGVVTGTIVPSDVVGPNAQGIEPGSFGELVAAIRAGVAYANVHTTRWPAGEIRGQINDANER
jgi:hypothetical protein